MLQHPLRDVKHTCLKHLKEFSWRLIQISEKDREIGAYFFHRWFIFHFKNNFFYTKEPLRKHFGAERFFFFSLFFEREGLVRSFSLSLKRVLGGKDGEGGSIFLEIQLSLSSVVGQIPAKIF